MNSGLLSGHEVRGLPRASLPTQYSKVSLHSIRWWQASWGPFLCFPSMTWDCGPGPGDQSPSFRDTHPYHWSLPHTSWLSALPPSEPHPQAYLSLPLWQTSRLHRPSPRRRHLPGGREDTEDTGVREQPVRTLKVLVAQSCLTLCDPVDCSLCPGNSPDKKTGVGSHSFLQGIFLTQRSILGLPHCRQILYHLGHQGSPYKQ